MSDVSKSLAAFLALLAVILLVFSLQSEYFLTVSNFLQAFKHLSITAIAALGLCFVVAVGKADMSFHFFSCFGAMAMSYFISIGYGPIFSVVAALILIAGLGLLNGVLVGRFDLPDMVTTIGTGTAVFGLAYLFSGGKYIYRNFIGSGIMQLNDGKLFDTIPVPVVLMAALYFFCWLLLHKSKYGRNFYAVGNKPLVARFSGISVARYIAIAFVISALLASIANMVQVSAQGKGEIRAGVTLLMPAWAAVFVGISIFKKPTVYGTFIGAFMISIMQNGFTLLSVPFYYMDFVVALSLIGSIILANFDVVTSWIQKKRRG